MYGYSHSQSSLFGDTSYNGSASSDVAASIILFM